jgi:hypothetical protein
VVFMGSPLPLSQSGRFAGRLPLQDREVDYFCFMIPFQDPDPCRSAVVRN